MFCPNCGTEIMKDALFCGNCGFKVEDFVINAEKPAAAPAPQQTISFEAAPAQSAPAPQPQAPVQQPVFQTTQPAVAPAPQQQTYNQNQFQAVDDNSTLATVVKIFMIIGCVAQGWMIIPLAWCLPMTISVFKSLKTGRPIGMGMKICTLLFVSLVSGVCLLCMKDDRK